MGVKVGQKALKLNLLPRVLDRQTFHLNIILPAPQNQQRQLPHLHHPVLFWHGHLQHLRVTINFIPLLQKGSHPHTAQELNLGVLYQAVHQGNLQDTRLLYYLWQPLYVHAAHC